MKIKNLLQALVKNERGVTSIEYGILAAGLAVAIGALVSSDGAFTKAINDIFSNVINAVPKVGAGK